MHNNTTDELKEFEAVVKKAAQKLDEFNFVVREVFYFHQTSYESKREAPNWEDNLKRELDLALQKQYLAEGFDGYVLNKEHPLVVSALKELNNVKVFLGKSSESFSQAYKKQHGIYPDLSDRNFWKQHFRVHD